MDIELNMIKLFNGLREVKNKNYSIYNNDIEEIYVFKSDEEFRSYFLKNGIDADDELLKMCTLKTTKKGNIIALKLLCDNAIKRGRIDKVLPDFEINDIHERGNITFSEKVSEWEKNGVCAPASTLRCDKFKNCHECMTEYASIKNEYQKSKVKK